ncbi:transient receptor potential cation channel subfamily A member 1-like [Lethenteron reissneri]|uniref:transient receptor potential cation channel subfamily A member 1-like n=1 Tax=Lethenteron reissneri TaxID=7753 RepID=UPI002AB7E495|nr:transient receptor potential cation channel subfamily A member 1-like [Lethenteron reissneri]XP_061410051.1 transient receptor potential cation channel subfamily A member 1-like [Lethenteron reissneri]XP_061410052.1 transient receptor potential cation channel subfamily A member 1-like [Lethenteron reissneri]XP_061410053.1 transient receptor potential cation channel subfamily A member 1-like [Lethenteron reissneri]XP_061410055.1 transient receptor potential cation channel subfamily A member 1
MFPDPGSKLLPADEEPRGSANDPDLDPDRLGRRFLSRFAKMTGSRGQRLADELGDLELLLRRGADINYSDRHGQTALHEAAGMCSVDVVQFLVERGAHVNRGDHHGCRPLHVAAAEDQADIVNFLMDAAALVEAQNKGELQTAVHYAARHDAISSLRSLADRGADVHARDYQNRTPLHVAISHGSKRAVQLLFELKADVSAEDDSRQSCLVLLICKMPSLALQALDQLQVDDRANSSQLFYLQRLEPGPTADIDGGSVHSPLELMVVYRLHEHILHPVVRQLIDIKWKAYGRRNSWLLLGMNLFFIVSWVALMVSVPWEVRHIYTFPGDTWRVVLAIVCLAQLFYFIVDELREIAQSKAALKRWCTQQRQQLARDFIYCHPRWPEEALHLQAELEKVKKIRHFYLLDLWNILDWLTYAMLLVVFITHLADVVKHSEKVAYVHLQLVAITVVPLWLRNMKHLRTFRVLGTLIVSLGEMSGQVVRFVFLLGEFYVSFFFSFWLVFGGSQVDTFKSVHEALYTLFRLNVIDDVEYTAMHEHDSVMTYLLAGTFLSLTAILSINIFIALMSDIFTRVEDSPSVNVYVQRAIVLLQIEGNRYIRRRRDELRRHVQLHCAPLAVYGISGDGEAARHWVEPPDTTGHIGELFVRVMALLRTGGPGKRKDGNGVSEVDEETSVAGEEVRSMQQSIRALRRELQQATEEQQSLQQALQDELELIYTCLQHLGITFTSTNVLTPEKCDNYSQAS